MTAEQKRKALDEVIERMAEAEDVAEVKRLDDKGYEYARGSNDRKDALRAAKQAAISRIQAVAQ